MMDWTLVISVMGPLVTLLIAIITLLYNKKNQLERQLDTEKRAALEDFINATIDAMDGVNMKNPKQQERHSQELQRQMKKIKKNLIMYGAPRTIRAHNRWMMNQLKEHSPDMETNFKDVERLIKAYRREVGLSNRFLRKYQVLQIIVRDDISQEIKKIKSSKSKRADA